MNANEQEPFSLPEFAAGSSALAAVVLIAFVGVWASQPHNPPGGAPSAVSASSPSAKASQRRRHVPTATARTRQGLPTSDVTKPVAESSGDDSANNARGANAAATMDAPALGVRVAAAPTRAAPASSFLVEAAPTTIVEMQSPEANGAPSPLFDPRDLFQTRGAITAPPESPAREEAIPAPPEPERSPSNRSDAIWIQTKLHDLGYFVGNGNGTWGPASRYALRDFKTMNGLAEDDKWDRETEHRLLSKQNVPASSTFIGGWAQSVEECQKFRGVGAPLMIRSRGAETDNVKCSFKWVKRDPGKMWHAQASCSAGGQSWNANVSLRLTGSNLNWSSENGKETYVRCVKHDVEVHSSPSEKSGTP